MSLIHPHVTLHFYKLPNSHQPNLAMSLRTHGSTPHDARMVIQTMTDVLP